jgi:hypothetical protein
MVLEKEEYQLERSCEIRVSGGKACHKNCKEKEGCLDSLNLAYGMSSKVLYLSRDTGKYRSDGKTRKKRKQLLDDLKEMRGYWTLKQKVLDRTICRTCFGRDHGPVV